MNSLDSATMDSALSTPSAVHMQAQAAGMGGLPAGMDSAYGSLPAQGNLQYTCSNSKTTLIARASCRGAHTAWLDLLLTVASFQGRLLTWILFCIVLQVGSSSLEGCSLFLAHPKAPSSPQAALPTTPPALTK